MGYSSHSRDLALLLATDLNLTVFLSQSKVVKRILCRAGMVQMISNFLMDDWRLFWLMLTFSVD